MELQVASPPALAAKSPRVLSIDVLRGIVMFTMVFVNDAYGAHGAPNWLKHYSDIKGNDGDGMTFVDVVFPAFLYIVGLSIPIAIENRRAKGDAWWKIIGHVLLRTASLIFLGVLMVNSPSDKTMGWPAGLWKMLLYAGALVTFHWLPLKGKRAQYISLGVRVLGLGLLIFLACVFRTKRGGTIEHSWWGILGLIGWAYFGATMVYLCLRKVGIEAMVGAVALLMAVFFADHANMFHQLQRWTPTIFGHELRVGSWIAIGETFGSQAAITMMGVVIGAMLLPTSSLQTALQRVRFALVFAVMMCIGAMLLHRNFPISKNDATPPWCLWCAAITTTLWVMLYLVIDVAGFRAWAIPIAWAGASALMIYILSEGWDIWHEHVRFLQWNWYDRLGEHYPAALWHKFITALAISVLAGVIGRLGLKLRL